VKSYAGTAAAAEAQRALAGPTEANGPRESQAVDEARALLRELLLMSDEERNKIDRRSRLRAIFRTLSVDQILEITKNTGPSLGRLPRELDAKEFGPKLEELMRKTDDATSAVAVDTLLNGGWQPPPELLANVTALGPATAKVLFEYLITRNDEASMEAAEKLLRNRKNVPVAFRDAGRERLVMRNDSPRLARLFEIGHVG
jgi:hypothetical protein